MPLTEVKRNLVHYFIDEHGRRQGEYKEYRPSGGLREHYICKDDKAHGEYKGYTTGGELWRHDIYLDGKLTDINLSTLSDKDKIVLTLQHEGIKFLPNEII